MPLDAHRLQFRARELYRTRDSKPALLECGFVEAGQELVVESAMEAGWLYLDGARMATAFPSARARPSGSPSNRCCSTPTRSAGRRCK